MSRDPGLGWVDLEAGGDTSAGDGALMLKKPLLRGFPIRCLVSGLGWPKDQLGRDY